MDLSRQALRRRIGVRLAIPVILFSSLVTLVITGLQLTADYRQQRDDLERQLDQIQVLLPSLAASLWTFNDRQLHLGLRAVTNLPNMDRADIVSAVGDSVWSEGESSSTQVITRKFPLLYAARGQEQQLGVLEVTASLDSIVHRLLSRAVTLLLSNGVKTFLVAAFMLALVHRLVSVRLADLERRMERLLPELDLPVPDGAPVDASRDGDEIESLGRGFRRMAERLMEAVQGLRAVEEELRLANVELDERVRLRTADLEAANRSLAETKGEAEAAAAAERRMRMEQRNFLSMVSHEFRGPLSVIGASSQLLGLGSGLDALSRDELEKITRAVRRMGDLIDVCLADERLDAGALCPGLTETDLCGLVEALCRDFQSQAAGRVVPLLPERPVLVMADGALLRIALSNLLDNALKYSPAGLPVEISLGTDGAQAVLAVRDQGPGIVEGEQTRIFEKYYRSPGTEGVRGAGLGLYLVKGIVQLHGGVIDVDGRQGRGTSITVRLPL